MEYNQQTRRREKVGMEERTVEAASMFDVNKAIMRCLVKNLAMFGLACMSMPGRICRKMLHSSQMQNPKSKRSAIHQSEAGTAAHALHLCPL